MIDFSVIGAGVGGSSIASLLHKEYETHIFEKEGYLGGCSGTFFRGNMGYNIGATTFAPYNEHSPLKELFDRTGAKPKLEKIDPAITVLTEKYRVDRYRDFERFLKEIERAFPNRKNREFWTLLKDISDKFYSRIGDIYYSRSSIRETVRSGVSLYRAFKDLPLKIFRNGETAIRELLPDISDDYYSFIENQVIIVSQNRPDSTIFLSVVLSLTYTLYDNFYSVGGMSSIVEELLSEVENLHRNEEIKKIERDGEGWRLHSDKGSYKSRNIILNRSIFSSAELFSDGSISRKLKSFKRFDSYQSAFVTYLKVKCSREFNHHYQIIREKTFLHSISNSIFISFSDVNDRSISGEGYYSVTVSTHTDSRFWKEDYKQKKRELQEEIVTELKAFFGIGSTNIVSVFSGTPNTFERYLGRSTLGGVPITLRNLLQTIPPDVGVNGLYLTGDNTFLSQGWIGVVKGALNLKGIIDERFNHN
jgi:phytoene dehydrogenase-like protein